MILDTYSHMGKTAKMLGRVAIVVTPLFIIVYMGLQTLSGAEAGPVPTPVDIEPLLSIEQSTRAILFEDLNEAWEHYETGEYSEAMWKQVYTHVTRNWNEQAKGKDWGEFGWTPPKTDETAQLSSNQTAIR